MGVMRGVACSGFLFPDVGKYGLGTIRNKVLCATEKGQTSLVTTSLVS